MRIAPRTLLCMNTVRVAGAIADTGFDELSELCTAAGDTVSLAIGMAGQMTALVFHNRYREAARLASDCSRLLESFADPALTLTILTFASSPLWQAGHAAEGLRLAQRAIDLADGDPTKGSLGPIRSPWRWQSSCVAAVDIVSASRAGGKTSIRRSRWPAAST